MTTISKVKQLAQKILVKTEAIYFDECLLKQWGVGHKEKKQVVVDRLAVNKQQLIQLIGEMAAIKI